MVAGHISASDTEAKRMLWRKAVSLLVMTVAVSSQMANAEISVQPAVRSSTADLRSDAHINGGYINANVTQAGLPTGSTVSSEFLLRDAGLRSMASNIYGSHAADAMDSWLMLLVGGGLVVLQLRRKQKSLPQRPLIESENKLFWG
jgi:hypothetical protein